MKDGEKIIGKGLSGVDFEGDAAEAEVEHFGAARRCFTENGISVGAGHGNAFRFALDRVIGARFNARRRSRRNSDGRRNPERGRRNGRGEGALRWRSRTRHFDRRRRSSRARG